MQHIPAIYTLEATFSGSLEGTFYTPDILKSIGRDLCRTLIPYCGLSIEFPLHKNIKAQEIKNNVDVSPNAADWKTKLMEELKGNKELLNMGDEDSSDNSGSDSEPSEDELDEKTITKYVPVDLRKKSPQKKEQKQARADSPRKKEKTKEEEEDKEKEKEKEKAIKEEFPRKISPQKIERKKEVKKTVTFQQMIPITTPSFRITRRESPFKKDIQPPNPQPKPAIVMIDATTQTEKADFQRAK